MNILFLFLRGKNIISSKFIMSKNKSCKSEKNLCSKRDKKHCNDSDAENHKCRNKGKYLKEVCRIVYDDSTQIVTDAFNTCLLSKYEITTWFSLIFESDLGLIDRLTNMYTPTEFDASATFDILGLIFTKEEYLEYVAVLYNLLRNYSTVPYGPCSGCDIYYSYKHPNTRFLIASVTNGTIIIDGNKLAKEKGQMSYNQAVSKGIIIKFIPSTWNTWHEYIQVGHYIYHIQEDRAVSNGMQIINMCDPYDPYVSKGNNLTFDNNNHRWHDRYTGNFQGAHFLQKENYRPYVWINGATPLDAWKKEYAFMFPTNYECETIMTDDRSIAKTKAIKPKTITKDITTKATTTKNALNSRHPTTDKIRESSHPYGRVVFGYDVCEPKTPKIIAIWHRVYAHDAKVLKRGCKYYLVMSAIFNESIYFIDITNPCHVDPLDKILYFCLPKLQGYPNLIGNEGFEAIPHSVYFSECGNFMYLFNENYDLNIYIFDISDICNARIIDEYRIPRFGSIIHEARREFIPSRGIDRLVIAAYDAGGIILDIHKNPAKPKLIGWNQSAIQKVNGAIIQSNILEDGYWSLVAMGQDDYSFGGIMGGGANGVGGIPNSATVLLQLSNSDPCCKKTNSCYSECEMLEAIALNDVFGSNDVKLDYMSRLRWFGCKDGCHRGHYKGCCTIPQSYKVTCLCK